MSEQPFYQYAILLLAYKAASLTVGVLCVYFGYRLFVVILPESAHLHGAGDLDSSAGAAHLNLRNTAPGTFFVVLGSAVIMLTVFKGFNLNEAITPSSIESPHSTGGVTASNNEGLVAGADTSATRRIRKESDNNDEKTSVPKQAKEGSSTRWGGYGALYRESVDKNSIRSVRMQMLAQQAELIAYQKQVVKLLKVNNSTFSQLLAEGAQNAIKMNELDRIRYSLNRSLIKSKYSLADSSLINKEILANLQDDILLAPVREEKQKKTQGVH